MGILMYHCVTLFKLKGTQLSNFQKLISNEKKNAVFKLQYFKIKLSVILTSLLQAVAQNIIQFWNHAKSVSKLKSFWA